MLSKKYFYIAGAYIAFAYYQYRNQSPLDTSSSVITDIMGQFATMKTSDSGKNAITQREGFRSVVYLDSVNIPTAGIGHKLRPSDNFAVGDTVDDATIQQWFLTDISHAEAIVWRFVQCSLDQNEYDALVSMAFNLGSALFRNVDGSQTQISRALDSGDYAKAASLISQWVYIHVNGVAVVNAGLQARRASESAQFLA